LEITASTIFHNVTVAATSTVKHVAPSVAPVLSATTTSAVIANVNTTLENLNATFASTATTVNATAATAAVNTTASSVLQTLTSALSADSLKDNLTRNAEKAAKSVAHVLLNSVNGKTVSEVMNTVTSRPPRTGT
jgi:hypothetical protein